MQKFWLVAKRKGHRLPPALLFKNCVEFQAFHRLFLGTIILGHY